MKTPARPAPWWQAVDRRTFGKGVLAFTTLISMSGCTSEEEIDGDSFDLQQKHGWNVGAEESRLFFTSIAEKDATGSDTWQPYTDAARLMDAWRPRTEAWQAFFAPALMQALKADSLRTQMRVIFTQGMREAFERGETLRRDLLSQVTKGGETLFIADLPGPEAVALGAGLASWADVVPTFSNWPHPYGVVRSHDTLAALLYYAAFIQERKQKLPAGAPGLLLLDSERLTPYSDEKTQFDNRYTAAVPTAAALQQRGIKQVMYITATREQKEESDDLNADFVAYKDANIQVVMFPLADLKRVEERVAKTEPDGTPRVVQEQRYYYGGGMDSHLGFLLLYSFLAPRPTLYYPPPVGTPYPASGGGFSGRSTSMGDLRPPTGMQAPGYTPRARPTLFSGLQTGGQAGIGRARPSGFGRTTVRTSSGRITGVGSSSGRSGSFGRSGSSSSS